MHNDNRIMSVMAAMLKGFSYMNVHYKNPLMRYTKQT